MDDWELQVIAGAVAVDVLESLGSWTGIGSLKGRETFKARQGAQQGITSRSRDKVKTGFCRKSIKLEREYS